MKEYWWKHNSFLNVLFKFLINLLIDFQIKYNIFVNLNIRQQTIRESIQSMVICYNYKFEIANEK